MSLTYKPDAAHRLLDPESLRDINKSVVDARDEVIRDVELLNSGDAFTDERKPLDAGFIQLPHELLLDAETNGDDSQLERIEEAANRLRGNVDNVVLLGIGGSYMGMRALFEALCHPYHNELDRSQRNGNPRLYYEGNNLDNDAITGLLQLIKDRCRDRDNISQRWGIIVISKSGGTLETAAAFRLFRQALEEYYGADSDNSRLTVIPVTGATGKLRRLSESRQYPSVFSIPDDVGGRFSIFTHVGLVPAAALGMDVRRLLKGAADMTDSFRTAPVGSNRVLDYVATCHAFERDHGLSIRVMSMWGKRLEALGLWYDQLLSESLGKRERGATPITAVNTRDLHSRGQQHQEGARDKLITNVTIANASTTAVVLPEFADDFDQLNQHAGKTIPNLLSAAFRGTNQAYADDNRPTADIVLPQLDEYALGQLFQMLMLATVVEGRMIGINPYGQPGVEAYKRNMTDILGNDTAS